MLHYGDKFYLENVYNNKRLTNDTQNGDYLTVEEEAGLVVGAGEKMVLRLATSGSLGGKGDELEETKNIIEGQSDDGKRSEAVKLRTIDRFILSAFRRAESGKWHENPSWKQLDLQVFGRYRRKLELLVGDP